MKRRNTAQRKLVLDAVSDRYDHPTADQIYLELKEGGHDVSKATVYRNLCVLEDEGALMEVEAAGANRYDAQTHPHYHITCTQCGKVADAPIDYQPAFDAAIASDKGWQAVHHQTMFTGLCPQCAAELEHQAR